VTDRPPPPIQKKGSKPQKARAYTDAIAMQTVMLQCVCNADEKATVRAACARAWCDLEERKRILRGTPMPGNLRPELQPKRGRRAQRDATLSPVLPSEPVSVPPGV
jgi:hypothetical protein